MSRPSCLLIAIFPRNNQIFPGRYLPKDAMDDILHASIKSNFWPKNLSMYCQRKAKSNKCGISPSVTKHNKTKC